MTVLGDRYLSLVGHLNHTRLCLGVLAALVALVLLFAGGRGLAVFTGAALVGLFPALLGARRASLMGVLLVPLAVS